MGAVMTASVVAFVLGKRPRLTGTLALVMLCVCAELEAAQLAGGAGVHHGKYLPMVVLLAWLVSHGDAHPQRGHGAACGVAGACYTLAGLSKLQAAGWSWGQDGSLALLIAERSVDAPATLQWIRGLLYQSPLLCAALASGTLLVELAGPLLILPAARRPYALILCALHVGIWVSLGFGYVLWVMVLLGLAFSRLSTPAR